MHDWGHPQRPQVEPPLTSTTSSVYGLQKDDSAKGSSERSSRSPPQKKGGAIQATAVTEGESVVARHSCHKQSSECGKYDAY